jgi:saccharopine dehydrogenase (NAD+, L-lysine-forming)
MPLIRPVCVLLSAQKDGQAKAIALALYHSDGYVFTAVPVVATLLQLLDGSARKPGLHLQAHIVEPRRLIRDLVRLGIEISGIKEKTNGNSTDN